MKTRSQKRKQPPDHRADVAAQLAAMGPTLAAHEAACAGVAALVAAMPRRLQLSYDRVCEWMTVTAVEAASVAQEGRRESRQYAKAYACADEVWETTGEQLATYAVLLESVPADAGTIVGATCLLELARNLVLQLRAARRLEARPPFPWFTLPICCVYINRPIEYLSMDTHEKERFDSGSIANVRVPPPVTLFTQRLFIQVGEGVGSASPADLPAIHIHCVDLNSYALSGTGLAGYVAGNPDDQFQWLSRDAAGDSVQPNTVQLTALDDCGAMMSTLTDDDVRVAVEGASVLSWDSSTLLLRYSVPMLAYHPITIRITVFGVDVPGSPATVLVRGVCCELGCSRICAPVAVVQCAELFFVFECLIVFIREWGARQTAHLKVI